MLGVLAGAVSAIDCLPPPPVPPFSDPARLVVSSGLTPSGSRDRTRITIYDRFNGLTSTPFAIADSVEVVRSGKTIIISGVLLDPCIPTNSIGPFDVDLGWLAPGLYTVSYSSGATNYSHEAVLRFTVADSGAATAWPLVHAVEYFHAGLDRYFITADLREIGALDNNLIRGWSRTGEDFPVFPADGIPGDSGPVCRLYGLPEAGLDSHFYSIDPDECAVVLERWPSSWTLEASVVFGAGYAFGSGVDESDAQIHHCDLGRPLFRLYSNGAGSDHRYTTSPQIRDAMIAEGWIAEGQYRAADGIPFAMCIPTER